MIKDDTVLQKGMKKTKQQNVNFNKDTSSVSTNKMHSEHNLENISSVSNSHVKKEKPKIHNKNKSLYFCTAT